MNGKEFLGRLAVIAAGAAAITVAAPAGASADVSPSATAKARAVVALHEDTTMAPMARFAQVCTPTACWNDCI